MTFSMPGVLAFFQAIAAYIIIVTEFGVEFSGTRAVSKNLGLDFGLIHRHVDACHNHQKHRELPL